MTTILTFAEKAESAEGHETGQQGGDNAETLG